MRVLLLTPDSRFAEALSRRGPDGVTFLPAADAAAAIRTLAAADVHALVLDGVTPKAVTDDFLAWWHASSDRAQIPVVLADAGRAQPLPPGAQRTPRDPEAIGLALLDAPILVLDRTRRELRGPDAAVALTPSEWALVGRLLRANDPVPTAALARDALGYPDQEGGTVVRTHLSNLRRKCASAGLPDPIAARRGQGYRLVGVRAEA